MESMTLPPMPQEEQYVTASNINSLINHQTQGHHHVYHHTQVGLPSVSALMPQMEQSQDPTMMGVGVGVPNPEGLLTGEEEKKGKKKKTGQTGLKKEKKDRPDFQTAYRKTKKSSIHRRITEVLEQLYPENPASLLRSYLQHSKRGQEINREMKLIEEKSSKSFPALINSMKRELQLKKNNKELEDLFIKLLCSAGHTREDVRLSLGVKKLGWKRWKRFRSLSGKKKDGNPNQGMEETTVFETEDPNNGIPGEDPTEQDDVQEDEVMQENEEHDQDHEPEHTVHQRQDQ